MLFRDQVTLFYNSDIVLSPHGTGLINIVFSIPHSTVIECFPPFYYENWFINTACQASLHYIAVFTRVTIGNNSLYQLAEDAYNKGGFLDLHSSKKNQIKDYDFNPLKFQVINAVIDAIEYTKRWRFEYETNNKFSPIFYFYFY